MASPLPAPTRSRWQPLRAGLVDLFYYDTEEFWFRDGRLLLRGNNGTGKSKVLALTLPFLLDGDLSPHRVEPDADPKKRMEWNLLLGGAHPHPERLGYTWLEFGRIDEHGEPRFRTIGCGLKAVSGRGIARHWYFVTRQRVGRVTGAADPQAPSGYLALVDATGTALPKDRLSEALGDAGATYDRARDYRKAVDEALFGLGEQRYGALVDLLVQLRQPQLSKRPSEKALSAALTEALPPLDQAVLADVAEAFRSLEEDRDSLTAMTEAHGAATSFLTHYRRYARIASRRRAALPREAQSAYERVGRDLAAAEAAYDKAVEDLAAARELLAELGTARTRLQARDEALRASPEMRSAHELRRAAQDAERLEADARRLSGERDGTARRLAGRREQHEAAVRRRDAAESDLTVARAAATTAATAARIAGDHAARVDTPLVGQPELVPHQELAALRREAEQLTTRQQRAVTHVEHLLAAVDEAAHGLAEARRKAAELDAEADDLAHRRTEADEAAAARGAELVSAVRAHLTAATELRLPDLAATLAELELWVDTLDGPNPATASVQAASQAAAGELARADAALQTRGSAAEQRRTDINAEITRLEQGDHSAPPPPYTRDAAAREERAGAPLWQLVDFADHVAPPDRAGVEAALEAAGVLDAWVTPAGDLLAADTGDVVLRPGARAATALDTVLRPAVDREDPRAGAVSDAVVATLLGSIGFADDTAATWVAADGRFRIGVLEGRWRKPVATYIGRGAREAARRARLAVLRAELSTVEEELTRVAAARTVLRDRTAALTAEVTSLPDDAAVRQAHAHVSTLAAAAHRLAAQQAAAAAATAAATATVTRAQAALDEGAGDADLPADRAALSEVDRALQDYRVALAGLWPAVSALDHAVRQEADSAADLAQVEADLAELSERAGDAQQEAHAATERYRTLSATVGTAVAELERQLTEVAAALRTNESEQNAARHQADDAIAAQGKAEGRRETLAGELDSATRERAAAAESFRRFAGTGLLRVALPELEAPDPDEAWAPHPTVRLARRVNDELADVPDDDQTWDRAQRRVTEEFKSLADTLSRHGNRASADLLEDGVVVAVEYRGRPTSVPELAEALAIEVADRERLLTEREREILENHLVNEVASTLQELISAAEEQVALMNRELAARPTSTGMQLRLLWRPREDGPDGLAAARERLLRQTADAWSESDRAAVGGFLQARIAEVRARDAAGTWLEHLTEALDYRAWNRFVIQRHSNGQWRSATGPASGGERVLAASVPLFAAASAHYESAGSPHAPRLITLDEAFAGVDDNARAKYLGLLAAFDLDVVMTSEREWGCYPEVPGLAISQLSRTDDVAAVLVTNWEWDGGRRTRVDRDAPLDEHLALPAAAQDGLFA